MPRDVANSNSSDSLIAQPDLVNSLSSTESRIDNYAQALDGLYQRIDYEKIGHAPYTHNNYRLDRMRQLLELLGSPQQSFQIVHIAGTKGKGTVATILYDCLRACGLRCGLYTSPHLLRLEERIQFDGSCCSESELVALTRTVLEAAAKLEATGIGRSTFFELTTAMGLLHFANKSAECVVLEVGLGGRLDSTNVCEPAVSVITSISLDHQAQLGSTIREIAGEKAGIIKPGTPVVCTAREREARETVERVAAEQSAPLRLLDRDYSVRWQVTDPESAPTKSVSSIEYSGDGQTSSFTTCMLGSHQADNIAGAIATLAVLRTQGWNLPEDKVSSAIAVSCPRARLEVVGTSPIRIIDTAHNPVSIQAALEAIDAHFKGKPKTIVFASSRDKDYPAMLQILVRRCDQLILTAYHLNPRALPSRELESVANELLAEYRNESEATPWARIYHAPTPAEAWELANRLATREAVILSTGSFFLAAELLPLLKESLGDAST